MPGIMSIGTTVPPYKIRQNEASQIVKNLFGHSDLELHRLLPIFQNTEIDERYFSAPIEWYEQNHGFATKNRLYVQTTLALCCEAVKKACESARIQPQEIDHIFFVSTTGISTPSIDAHLLNLLHFKAGIRRTPIWGLGCAGGVAGLSRAYDWLKAYTDKIALVIAVELCSLTFIRNDLSKNNFVATALFGDGCAAALLVGDRHKARINRTLQIQDNASITWRDSLDVMGWEIDASGFKVIFSQSIPTIVSHSSLHAITEFLEKNRMDMKNIDYFLSHPGGAKVIQAYKKTLELEESQIESMRAVLRKYGNMSSTTVFFVLKHFLNSSRYRGNATLLSAALGPGFSSEMLLMRSCT
jgi:alkylresorcinol/alkylpyrone synthase